MAEFQGLLTRNDINDKTEMTEEDQRLTLAYEGLDTMPEFLVSNFCMFIKILDISHNKFSDVSFLKDFKNLTALILDHNKIDSETKFYPIPSLELLWLNHNMISRLFPFIKHLHHCFPKLKQLSLMDNPGVPPDIDDTTFYQHLQYRLFTISWFPHLIHLDSRKVSQYEHEEASRLYKRPWFERISASSLVSNDWNGC
ncbi:leucine-rich melanocyte differentiation-associated protein-like isoform X2 [Lycorma delicatula]|uniref:leucine-rich melanocyte differentiation-associated protein-like isoform X2 n=1 Tax=Lycorma delicatula TaxID=130591 RepID=UPI003F51417A